jgi:16S rRNA (cytidine1402-2'-O)-methyltransferase
MADMDDTTNRNEAADRPAALDCETVEERGAATAQRAAAERGAATDEHAAVSRAVATGSRRVIIALGSNLASWAGDPPATLMAAVAAIEALEGVRVCSLSPLMQSAPAYRTDQPTFTNAVALLEVEQEDPFALLRALKGIEERFGRTHGEVNGPRTLDVDIIDFEGVVSDEPVLLLPHPLALERDFVVEPLLAIAPAVVFADGSSVAEVWREAGRPFFESSTEEGRSEGSAEGRGALLICATPIGNLGDLTPRVAQALASVDLILAEDTRVTRRLLTHLNLRVPMERCDEHVIREKTPALIHRIQEGSRMAYVSDAGTPGISDPGMHLVAACRRAGIPVEVLPGVSAVTCALAAAGFETTAFYFGGFLPRRDAQRHELLARLATLDAALVFYESPHRVCASLEAIAATFPEREAVFARELTKRHEEVFRAPTKDLAARIAQRSSEQPLKGEIVLVIGPPARLRPRRTHRDRYARRPDAPAPTSDRSSSSRPDKSQTAPA